MDFIFGCILGNIVGSNGMTLLKPRVIWISGFDNGKRYYANVADDAETDTFGDWSITHRFLFSVFRIGDFKKYYVRPISIKFDK